MAPWTLAMVDFVKKNNFAPKRREDVIQEGMKHVPPERGYRRSERHIATERRNSRKKGRVTTRDDDRRVRPKSYEEIVEIGRRIMVNSTMQNLKRYRGLKSFLDENGTEYVYFEANPPK